MKTVNILIFSLFMTIPLFGADEATVPFGQLLDPENIENVGKASSAVEAGAAGKKIYGSADKAKTLKDMGKDALTTYQQSKSGTMRFIQKTSKKMSTIIKKAQKKVNSWRTTLPRLKQYTRSTKNFFGGTYRHIQTAKISDFWDIDRNFTQDLEFRILDGRFIGMSIWDYLSGRVDDESTWDIIKSAFSVDIVSELDKMAVDDYFYEDRTSSQDKAVYFVQSQAYDALHMVKEISKDQFLPSKNASALSNRQYDNKRLGELLNDKNADFSDQLSLNQDILSQQFKIAVHRSRLQDERSNLDLLWGRLVTRGMERKEKNIQDLNTELAELGGYGEIDVDAYMRKLYASDYKREGE